MTILAPRRLGAMLAGAVLVLGLAAAMLEHRVGPPALALLGVGSVAAAILLVGAGGAPAPSVASGARPRLPRARLAVVIAGTVMVGGLVLALVAPAATTTALELVAAGALSGVVLVAPSLVAQLRALVRGGLGVAAVAAVVTGMIVGHVGAGVLPGGLGSLVGLAALVVGGALLIADGLGITRRVAAPESPWNLITGRRRERTGTSPRRVIAGGLLIAWAIGIAIVLAESSVSGRPLAGALTALGVLLGAGLVVAVPLAIAGLVRRQREAADRTREDERQRIAAHLHDSVLQTLAVVQRRSADPEVTLIARRQEASLRAWMAGESELTSDSLSAELQAVVGEVEDAAQVGIELSMIGDRLAEARDEALIGATREALRNAVAHARGSPVTVYAEVGPRLVEVFVSDEGPGFVLGDVPEARRGIRDSIIARMSAVGGSAEITTEPGHGTDVLLRLPAIR